MKKYHVWLTAEKGEGHTLLFGTFEDITDFKYCSWFFSNDLELTITYEEE